MEQFNPFAGGEILKVSPTTGPQKEVIACAQLSDSANTAYNEAITLKLQGAIDAGLLESCLNTLHSRHDLLRATFSRRGDEICLQEDKPFHLQVVDLTADSPQIQQQKLQDLKKNIAISPMNLEEGPLFFAWLYQLSDNDAELIIAAHHIVCDGWSFGLLLNELSTLYRAGGNSDQLPAAPSFFDFAEKAAASEITNSDIDYWSERFKQTPPSLDLPLDFPRPRSRTFQATRLDYQLNQSLVEKLPKAAAANKASLVNFVMAGYFALLHRLTGNDNIIVGLPVAGQAALQQLNLFGHMVQLLPIQVTPEPETPFRDLLASVKAEVLNASEHPNFTFGQLVKKLSVDRTRVPLINTLFNIDQPMPPLDFGSATGTLDSIPRSAEAFELFLNVVPTKQSLTIEATYSTALFRESTINAWMGALETLLHAVVENPELPLGSIPLSESVPEALSAANQTEQKLTYTSVIEGFNARAAGNPDSIALISGDESVSYATLNEHSDALAAHLSQQGIRPGDVVGLCCERTADLVIATLAIMKTGAAYLPLDPDFPPQRLSYMVEDSSASAILLDQAAPRALSETNARQIDLPQAISAAKEAGAATAATGNINPNDCAYIIYTSGSTGKPKGVRVAHHSMINFLESMAQQPGCTAQDKLLALTTLSFDISVLEIYLPLISGGTTVLANREQIKEGSRLAELIRKHGISLMQATPSTWRLLMASEWQNASGGPKLKALCGGEPLPLDLTEQLLPRVSELWNMYGPTETTVWSTCKKISAEDPQISVGKAIANTQVYLLDEALQPVPLSVPGEICIGGDGVTLGYHERPELNESRFIDHPSFGRIYRTGDLGKLLPNGDIQHLGRMDDQVKLRGYRIELGEIENALVKCDSVAQAAVYLWTLSATDTRVVACCVPEPGQAIQNVALRKQLRDLLPTYMIPQYFLTLDALPLTANGKINRRELPRPELTESTLLSQRALQNDTEKQLAAIWTEVIKPASAVGPDDNFFEIGGHSLLALEAIRQTEITCHHRFTTADLVTHRLSELAEIINTQAESQALTEQGPEALGAGEKHTLTPEQERILNRQLQQPSATCNNLPASWIISGALDENALQHSLQNLFDRQTALRTRIGKSGDQWFQYTVPVEQLELPEKVDVSEAGDPLQAALDAAGQLALAPFTVVDQPLCRISLYRLEEQKHLLVAVPHQLIFDGWSFDIFLTELEKYYAGYTRGQATDLSKPAFEFRDYAHWYRHRLTDEAALSYHRQSLENLPEIPKNQINTSAEKAECARREFPFDKAALVALEHFCERFHLRLHEVLFSAFAAALGKATGQQELLMGLPVTGRYNPDVINLVGSFVSTLPFRARLSGGGFVAVARDMATQLTEFHQHQDISCAEILRGTALEHALFTPQIPASFGYQDIRNRPNQLAGLKLAQIDMPRTQTELPIEFWTRIHPEGLVAVFDFDSGQVNADIIQQIASLLLETINSLESLEEPPADETAPQSEPASGKKPFWRRLFQ